MGYFGYGYGHGTPQAAKDLAEKFFNGGNLKRTNCEVYNGGYWLKGNLIAENITDPAEIARRVAHKLEYGSALPLRRYSFAGWATDMTARHLNALGVKAEVRRVGPRGDRRTVALLNGRQVIPSAMYTLEQLAELPLFVEEVPPPRPPRFVNATLPLFA
jgi:hypothetical protein